MKSMLANLYLCLFITIFIVSAFMVDAHVKTDRENKVYREYLTSATSDAMKTVSINDNRCAFENDGDRKIAINTFYRSMALSMQVLPINAKDVISPYVPCIALIDNDGFYISYDEKYTDDQGVSVKDSIVTPKYAWSSTYGNYMVTYSLNDEVMIENKNTGRTFKGYYYEAFVDAGSPASLAFMDNEESFDAERDSIVITTVNDKIDYFINEERNSYLNETDEKYSFTMPQIANEDWARILQGPTMIAFFQGKQMQHYDNFINVYALCGAEYTKIESYYMTKEGSAKLYHKKGCSHIADLTKIVETGNLEKMAKSGAEPCFECIN